MKKFLLVFIALSLALGGCVHIDMPDPAPQTVYASFAPIYALSQAICKDVPNLRLYCLAQPQDGCVRSYELSNWDAALLQGADLAILGGRGLESFENALQGGEIAVLTAMDNMVLLGAEEESTDESGHFIGPNPWLFLSLDGAENMLSVIAGGMAQLDPDFAEIYARNLDEALVKVENARAEIAALLAGKQWPPMALAQEGLAYIARDLGMEAAVEIEREAGSDMSDNELADALEILRKSGCEVILLEKQAPQGLAEELEKEGFRTVLIDIFTDRANPDFDEYIEAMLANARAIAEIVE